MGLENQAFSDQVNLDNIQYNRNSHWERSQKPDPGEEESLYNEKNYYYTFVHNIVYPKKHKKSSEYFPFYADKQGDMV